jgi:hypothetical protein
MARSKSPRIPQRRHQALGSSTILPAAGVLIVKSIDRKRSSVASLCVPDESAWQAEAQFLDPAEPDDTSRRCQSHTLDQVVRRVRSIRGHVWRMAAATHLHPAGCVQARAERHPGSRNILLYAGTCLQARGNGATCGAGPLREQSRFREFACRRLWFFQAPLR